MTITNTTTSQPVVDAYVRERMETVHIPGLALAIIRDDTILVQQGYGFANLEHEVPVTADSSFEIRSVSKQFAVTAIMRMVETGELELDKPIHSYRSDLPDAWSGITVRHLLTATSGIKDYANEFPSDIVPLQASSQAILQFISTHELNFPYGERWSYCNTGFVVLSLIIEQCSGVSYREFLNTHILTPLGMHSTYANDLRRVIPNRVAGYMWADSTWHNRTVLGAGKQSNGDGELVSTLTDLIKWDAAWRSERLLKSPSLQQIWTPAKVNSGALARAEMPLWGPFTHGLPAYHYGFGWFLGEHRGLPIHWTPGAGEGFSTTRMHFPDDDLTIIVLINLQEFLLADAIARSIGELVW